MARVIPKISAERSSVPALPGSDTPASTSAGGTVEQVVKRFAPGGKDRENAGRRLEFGKFRHGPLGDQEGPGGEFVQEGGGESGAPPFREVQLLDVAAGGQGIAEQRASFNGIAAKGLAAGPLCVAL